MRSLTSHLPLLTADRENDPFDFLDRRIKTAVGSTTRWTAYDGAAAVLDFDGSGAVTVRYLRGAAVDELLARETRSGGVSWYLPDRQGSIHEVTGSKGAILDHIDYTAFGKVAAESAATKGDRYKYAGMESDSETGL